MNHRLFYSIANFHTHNHQKIASKYTRTEHQLKKPKKDRKKKAKPSLRKVSLKPEMSRQAQFKKATQLKKHQHSKHFINHKLALTFLILFLLATEAYANNLKQTKTTKLVSRKIPKYPLEDHNEDILNEINQTCTARSYWMSNKPIDIRTDMAINKTWTTSDCARDERSYFNVNANNLTIPSTYGTACTTSSEKYLGWRTSPNALYLKQQVLQLRNNISSEVNKALSDLDTELVSVKPAIISSLTQANRDRFDQYIETIRDLNYFSIVLKDAKNTEIGNCGEHARSDLMQILKIGLKYNTIVRLQLVLVSRDGMDNHAFVIVNSNAKDIVIQKDEVATTAYLTDLKKGQICDRWNDRYFSDITANNNALYNYGWDSVTVKNYSLDFDFSGLSEAATNFLKNQLSKLELATLFGKPESGLFAKKPVATVPSTECMPWCML